MTNITSPSFLFFSYTPPLCTCHGLGDYVVLLNSPKWAIHLNCDFGYAAYCGLVDKPIILPECYHTTNNDKVRIQCQCGRKGVAISPLEKRCPDCGYLVKIIILKNNSCSIV